MTGSPEAFRQPIFPAVLPVLEADESVRACWEGGSVAMGRADEVAGPAQISAQLPAVARLAAALFDELGATAPEPPSPR